MKLLGNFAWLILGGFITSVMYIAAGLVFCITIVGIPFGLQLIKIGGYALWPFGRTVAMAEGEPGCLSLAGNILWIIMGWWEIAIIHVICGLLFCITIIGIPFGKKHFTIAMLSLFPFGQQSIKK